MSVKDFYCIDFIVKIPTTSTVKFYDGNKLILEQTYNVGQEIAIPNLVIGNRKFIGWTDSEGNKVKGGFLSVGLDEVYTANFTKQYTVTFICDGVTISTQTVNEGDSAIVPNLTKKNGVVLWSANASYYYVLKDIVANGEWYYEE